MILKLLKVHGVGPVLTNKIINGLSISNGDVSKAFETIHDELAKWLKKEQIQEYKLADNKLSAQISEIERRGGFVTLMDRNYPHLLLEGAKNSAPPILSYFGNLNLLTRDSVGFCGSRKVSSRGLKVTRDCVEQFSKDGIVIVSGYAAGVDRIAHYTALKNNGTTIVILPEGLLNFSIRRDLSDVWEWDRTLVISEFLPDARWSASRAMQRNKTIIGLSKAMILIEASAKGGSIDAGKKTLAMGRKLFTPIYEEMPDFAVGNQLLLERGAIPLKKSKDSGKAVLNKIKDELSPSKEGVKHTHRQGSFSF